MVLSYKAPIGILLLQQCCRLGKYRRVVYQSSVLFLTFVAYTAFHLSRRPLAVVKNSLNQDCSKLSPPPGLILTNETKYSWCNWAPFDKSNANTLLGLLDFASGFAYAIGLFISGMIAERMNLRYFLTLGMLICGFFTGIFGLAYFLNIHSLAFFVAVQLLSGASQSTGYPAVVACIGNWSGKSRRGLIFGIWNSQANIGNIAGAYIAGYFIVYNWGLSFIVPGAILQIVGVILFFFLVPHPEDVDCSPTNHQDEEKKTETDIFYPPSGNNASHDGLKSSRGENFNEKTPFANKSSQETPKYDKKKAISFLDALRIPGVIEFSLCLFFCKLVCYTFLYWLPRYISYVTGSGSQSSAYQSMAFDIGGIIGGIAAGLISDHTRSSSLTCIGFFALTIPSLFAFEAYGGASQISNIVLQIVCGILVNGPIGLITSVVTVELATNKNIKSNAKATVAAFIDGIGSFGSAVGPFIAGVVSEYSWSYVFYIMMLVNFLALVSLLRTATKDFKDFYELKCSIPFVGKKLNVPYEQI